VLALAMTIGNDLEEFQEVIGISEARSSEGLVT